MTYPNSTLPLSIFIFLLYGLFTILFSALFYFPTYIKNKGGSPITVIQTNDASFTLPIRLICAKAEGEGQLGILTIRNVGVNRIRADCLDFKVLHPL